MVEEVSPVGIHLHMYIHVHSLANCSLMLLCVSQHAPGKLNPQQMRDIDMPVPGLLPSQTESPSSPVLGLLCLFIQQVMMGSGWRVKICRSIGHAAVDGKPPVHCCTQPQGAALQRTCIMTSCIPMLATGKTAVPGQAVATGTLQVKPFNPTLSLFA